MKKLTIIFAAVLIVAGLASSAGAGPDWSNGRRFDNRGKYDRAHFRYDQREYRGPYQQHVYYTPVRAQQQVVHVAQPYVPSFSIFLPNLSIQIR